MKKVLSFLLIVCMILSMNSCGNPEKEAYSTSFLNCFDTVITITAYSKTEEEARKIFVEAQEEYLYYHQLFDIYNEYSEMNNAATINAAAGKNAVVVPKDLFDLIKLGIDMYDKTSGNVNIAFGAVLLKWHEAREFSTSNPDNAYIPSMIDLEEANMHCSIDDIILNESDNSVFLKDEAMSIDLGAIAKGYATELVAKKLAEDGYDSIIISAGGNAKTLGLKPENNNWVVAIENPDKENGQAFIETIGVGSDVSVVTSGTYERFFDFNGKKYHHIINKDTLMPKDNYLSVTIVTADSGLADALSTALFNLPLDEGRAFIDSLDGVEAMWILSDKSIVQTDGFSKLVLHN